MIWAVVPTCRGFTIPVQTEEVHWVLVHDRERQPHTAPQGVEPVHIVAPDPWLYGQGSDSIRSAGFVHAYKHGGEGDIILTVDDDCALPRDWAAQHAAALRQTVPAWTPTIPGLITRGMPQQGLLVGISHGLWDGVPDVYAHDQTDPPQYQRIQAPSGPITPPFPQSSMNLGFRRELTPVLYQPAQGPDTGMDRFADIWGGIMAQRLIAGRYGCWNGAAVVYHARASNREANLEKERPGLAIHDAFWKLVWSFQESWELEDAYVQLANYLAKRWAQDAGRNYVMELTRRMRAWIREVRH